MKHQVVARISQVLQRLAQEHSLRETLPVVIVERPKKAEHGDYASNIALAACKWFRLKPRELADVLASRLRMDDFFEQVEVAGPGFLNVKLKSSAFHQFLRHILNEGCFFGRARAASGERINLEFVSANPTGPLHMAHGRGAVAGDVVGRLLEATGHRVVREYYVNDAGNQIKLLATSVLARAYNEATPEGGYGGAYVTELADWAQKTYPELVHERAETKLAQKLVAIMLRGWSPNHGIQNTLKRLGIYFDVWFSEATLHNEGCVDGALTTLSQEGWLREQEGALFFEASRVESEDGSLDEKDRVLRKSDGSHTYFASDIAYHKDKIDRGFDRLIDVWGADHHGYAPRVRAALKALGLPEEKFEVLFVQMVSLLKDGQPYRMGKRLGNFITIDEVIDEIDNAAGRPNAGRDALRDFFNSRRIDAQLEIDVEIAKKQSIDNPAFYLQAGHARICSILRKARLECGLEPEEFPDDLSQLKHPDELSLIAKLADWPDLLIEAAQLREPHRVTHYLIDISQAFQSYFSRLYKEGDTVLPRKSERDDQLWRTKDNGLYLAKIRARLAWLCALRNVYAAGLELLGITALERFERLPTSIEPKEEEDF